MEKNVHMLNREIDEKILSPFYFKIFLFIIASKNKIESQ
uniref:Uncharacterized protein n=1 Tax=Romanomermis culicivorax TaxID=13658 RepID=A0A915IM76_ROMCU